MAVLAWTMTGLALWHFTIFIDDKFWGGIVGAFLAALVGSVLFGFLLHGFSIPSREATDVLTALEAIPGTVIGLAAAWIYGSRREAQAAQAQPGGLPG